MQDYDEHLRRNVSMAMNVFIQSALKFAIIMSQQKMVKVNERYCIIEGNGTIIQFTL